MKILLVASLVAVGCGPSGPGSIREPDEFIGCATDEHWRTFDDQEPLVKPDDATGPKVTAPAGGATLPFAQKPIFKWDLSGTDPGSPPGGDVPSSCSNYNLGGLMALHLPPISGNVYDLQFYANGKIFYRALTTLQEWQPPDTTGYSMLPGWASFRGKSVTLKLYRMDLVKNDVRPGVGGPFVATQPFPFTVGS
jgi:hypothetical protein